MDGFMNHHLMCLRKLLQTVLKEIFVFNIKVIVVNQNLESIFFFFFFYNINKERILKEQKILIGWTKLHTIFFLNQY